MGRDSEAGRVFRIYVFSVGRRLLSDVLYMTYVDRRTRWLKGGGREVMTGGDEGVKVRRSLARVLVCASMRPASREISA